MVVRGACADASAQNVRPCLRLVRGGSQVRTGPEHLFVAPAGSLAIFTSHTLHGRNQFLSGMLTQGGEGGRPPALGLAVA